MISRETAPLGVVSRITNVVTVVVSLWRIPNGNQNPQKSSDPKAIIDRLRLEKIPLAEIARVMQTSKAWLQHYI